MLKQIVAEQYNTIPLGYQNENESTEIVFDLSAVMDKHQDGTLSALFIQPGIKDPVPIIITVDYEERRAYWVVKQSQVVNYGRGKIQLTWSYDEGKKEKTKVWNTVTSESITGTPVAPADVPQWIEQLTELGAITVSNAQIAEEAKESALESANIAIEAKESVLESVETVEQVKELVIEAKDEALQAAEEAAKSAEDAIEAANHSPYIDDSTGHWFVWDAEEKTHVDSGIKARGDDAPQIDDEQASPDHPWSGKKVHDEIAAISTEISAENVTYDSTQEYSVGTIGNEVKGKVSINQGETYSGKCLVIDDEGQVVPGEFVSETAKQLETKRKITLDGVTSGDVLFDGSEDVVLHTTLSTLSNSELEELLI